MTLGRVAHGEDVTRGEQDPDALPHAVQDPRDSRRIVASDAMSRIWELSLSGAVCLERRGWAPPISQN